VAQPLRVRCARPNLFQTNLSSPYPGAEKQRFEREGGKPQQGFSVAQGRATEKAVPLAVRDPMEVELRVSPKGLESPSNPKGSAVTMGAGLRPGAKAPGAKRGRNTKFF